MDYFNMYDQELIKELEVLYPGPYIVYLFDKFPITELYTHGFKLGVTRKPKQRYRRLQLEAGEKLSLPKVILKTNSLLEAAIKEREIGLELGINGEINYIKDLIRQRSSQRVEVIRKRVRNTDYSKSQNYCKKPVKATYKDGTVMEFESIAKCRDTLKLDAGALSAVLSPNYCQKTTYGWKVEYV